MSIYYDYRDDDSSEGQNIRALISAFERRSPETYFDVDSLDKIALHYFESGRFEEALSAIDQILSVKPFSAYTCLKRGV
ncbi:MAG: hypothetical protein F4096_12150, partial [Rhodothermaceae bacterium]|nr:hypothetical protein [Rhodothermaceae bacterium]